MQERQRVRLLEIWGPDQTVRHRRRPTCQARVRRGVLDTVRGRFMHGRKEQSRESGRPNRGLTAASRLPRLPSMGGLMMPQGRLLSVCGARRPYSFSLFSQVPQGLQVLAPGVHRRPAASRLSGRLAGTTRPTQLPPKSHSHRRLPGRHRPVGERGPWSASRHASARPSVNPYPTTSPRIQPDHALDHRHDSIAHPEDDSRLGGERRRFKPIPGRRCV
jgi:hypothetical protein